MDAKEGIGDGGWLKTFLKDRFDAADHRFDCLERKVGLLGDHVARLEERRDADASSRRDRGRWLAGLRNWWVALVGTGEVAWLFWRGHQGGG